MKPPSAFLAVVFLALVALIFLMSSMSPASFFISIAPPALYFLTVPAAFLERPPCLSFSSVFSPGCSCSSCCLKAFLISDLSCFLSTSPPSFILPPEHIFAFSTAFETPPPHFIFTIGLKPSIIISLRLIVNWDDQFPNYTNANKGIISPLFFKC